MVVHQNALEHRLFRDLPSVMKSGDVLVLATKSQDAHGVLALWSRQPVGPGGQRAGEVLPVFTLQNGLPRPHHPLFNEPHFDRVTQDRFFFCIEAVDPKFDTDATWEFLENLKPEGLYAVQDVA